MHEDRVLKELEGRVIEVKRLLETCEKDVENTQHMLKQTLNRKDKLKRYIVDYANAIAILSKP
jgi:hypothetical protein